MNTPHPHLGVWHLNAREKQTLFVFPGVLKSDGNESSTPYACGFGPFATNWIFSLYEMLQDGI